MHIVSRREQHSRPEARASLTEMQFSLPVDSRGGLKILSQGTLLRNADDSLEVWQPRRGAEFPEYLRTLDTSGKSLPPWLDQSDSMSGHSDAGDVADVYMASNGILSLSRHVSPPTRRPSEERSVHADISQADPDVEAARACYAPSHRESCSLTDGSPPKHHKRFSGWSFPSVQLTGQEEDSVHTDLEEMRFASPSPERVVPKPSPRPESNVDLSSSSSRASYP